MLSSRTVYKKAYEEHLEYLNYAEAIKIYAIELKSINKLQTPGLIDLLDMVILLAKTYQQAPREDVLASIKTNFTNTILILLPKLPIDKQLEFYKTVCLFCLDLDKQITNSTFAYFANAIHLAEQLNQQDVLITKELEKFKIQARFSAMRPLIDYKLDKQNMIETYNIWQEIRPCLESAMALDIDSASYLFKSLENKLNLYAAAFLSGSNDTQLLQLKLNKLSEDAKGLLAYNYEPYQRIARSWLHYIISKTELEGIREAWENEKFKEKIYPKGQDSINGDFSLAKQYREELKALRAEFELNIKQPIFKTQANYTTQVINLLNNLAKDVASSLGEAPCTYNWIGIGSVSKGLLSPYSDLDCAILIENAEYRNHPYFTSFILSLDAVLKSLAEPWEFSAREEASCVGLRIDGGDLELIQAKKMPFIGTPLELANWVIEVGRTINETEQDEINYTDQTLAFSLLSPCLLYSRHNNNLLSTYQEQLYKNLSGICSITGQLVHEIIAINFWHSLITDDLNKSNLNIQQTSIDLKHDCIKPLINLCTIAGLYYLINTKGILEANIGSILTKLEKKQCWHINYVKEIKAALEFLYKTRAKLHFKSSQCYDTIELQNIPKWQAFKLASLTPWQGLVKLKYIFNGEENYHPLFVYARLIKEGLVSNQKLTFDLELESLAYLPQSDLYNTYLLLPNEYRMYVIQGLQAIDAPIAILEYYLNLPNHLGISLNKKKNLLAWQKTLFDITEEYNPQQKANYLKNKRVKLEFLVLEDGRVQKKTRLFPQNYMHNQQKYCYFKKNNLDIEQLQTNGRYVHEGRSQVIKLLKNQQILAYAKLYPENPGVQLQADSLSQRLTGVNFHSTLAKVTPLAKPKAYFPLLFSQALPETLQQQLHNNDLTAIEQQLDPFYFSLKIFETLSINPEDDKPDNIGLITLANGSYRLISFDSDHAFYPAVVERGSSLRNGTRQRKLQLKSLSLCFLQMQNNINPEARALFLSLSAYGLLKDYLLELDSYYQEKLFTETEIKDFLEAKDKEKQAWLACAFELGTVAALYVKIKRIQAALQDQEVKTHLDLLIRIEPLASDYYLKVHQAQYSSPKARWEALLPDTEYKVITNEVTGHIECQSVSQVQTRAKNSLTIINEKDIARRKDNIRKMQINHPKQALEKELEGIYQQYHTIGNLIAELLQANTDNFVNVYPFIQEQTLKRLDFAKINYGDNLKTQKLNQTNIITAIKKLKNLRELHLINYMFLSYADLIDILKNNKELRILNLSGCKNLSDDFRGMWWALSYVPQLEYLDLSNTNIAVLAATIPGRQLTLLKLKYLILKGCTSLYSLSIHCPKLQYFKINNCLSLTLSSIKLKVGALKNLLRLVVAGEQEQAESILITNPYLTFLPGNVTDLSGRNFKHITCFQYAVWALDSHMWTMLKKYLPIEAQSKQLQDMSIGSWVNQHGKLASWQNLIDAMKEFFNLLDQLQWKEASDQWMGPVRNVQQQLPVHVVNQYCHPARSFEPCPNFKEELNLPRFRQTRFGDWFSPQAPTIVWAAYGIGAFDRGSSSDVTALPGCLFSIPSPSDIFGGVGDAFPWTASFTSQIPIDYNAITVYLRDQKELYEKLVNDIELKSQKKISTIEGQYSSNATHFIKPIVIINDDETIQQQKLQIYNLKLALKNELKDVHQQNQKIISLVAEIHNANTINFVQDTQFIQGKTLKKIDFSAINHIDKLASTILTSLKPGLKELHLKNCHALYFSKLKKILEDNPKLRIMNLSGCNNLKDSFGNSMESILRPLLYLKYINLSGTNIKSLSRWGGQAEFILPNLKHLILQDCFALIELKITCPTLSRLKIKNCPILASNQIINFIQNLPSKAVLNIDNLGFTTKITAIDLNTTNKLALLIFSRASKHCIIENIQVAEIKNGYNFLKLVVEGEQEQAEKLLTQYKNLSLFAGDVTDLSGRTFNNITGFQYAVWALDWHMWNMLCKYLPLQVQQDQLQAMKTGSWVQQHGKSASWQNLIDAIEKFIYLCKQRGFNVPALCKAVGEAQLLLPAHVINEYCHPDRPFYPCPNFNNQDPLPRSQKFHLGFWFSAKYFGSGLGGSFAIYRSNNDTPWFESVLAWFGLGGRGVCINDWERDYEALIALLNCRMQQRDELTTEIARACRNESIKNSGVYRPKEWEEPFLTQMACNVPGQEMLLSYELIESEHSLRTNLKYQPEEFSNTLEQQQLQTAISLSLASDKLGSSMESYDTAILPKFFSSPIIITQTTSVAKKARDLEGNLEQELYEIELPGDGNCALHGLGISRNKAVEQLINNGRLDAKIRNSMLQDINELINEAESVTSNIQGVTTTEIYIALKREKDLVLFTLNQKMNFLNDRLELNGNDCKNDLPGFLDLLGEFSPEYLELQKLEQEKLLAEQAILDYLMLPDIYENFIHSSYEKPKVDGSWQWLSFVVMQVLAEINKINLVIKKLSADNTYDSMYEWIINDGPVRTLLYTQAGTKDGYNGSNLNHFNALSIVPDKLCDPVRMNIVSSDKLTATQRENNFNLFNQKQPVSKSKNLIWSQVQENISIDSNFQNSCVDPVFDELVDTGFFNSFEDDFDESDMVETTKYRSKFQ